MTRCFVVASSGYYRYDYGMGVPTTISGAPSLVASWGGYGGETFVSVYGIEDPAQAPIDVRDLAVVSREDICKLSD